MDYVSYSFYQFFLYMSIIPLSEIIHKYIIKQEYNLLFFPKVICDMIMEYVNDEIVLNITKKYVTKNEYLIELKSDVKINYIEQHLSFNLQLIKTNDNNFSVNIMLYNFLIGDDVCKIYISKNKQLLHHKLPKKILDPVNNYLYLFLNEYAKNIYNDECYISQHSTQLNYNSKCVQISNNVYECYQIMDKKNVHEFKIEIINHDKLKNVIDVIKYVLSNIFLFINF